MNDQQLIEQCLDGVKGAWEAFIEKFSPLMYSLVHKCLRAKTRDYVEQDMEDILENSVMALLENDFKLLRDYDPTYRFSTWLGVIVRTQVGRYLRKKKGKIVSLEELGGGDSDERSWEPEGKSLDPSAFSGEKEELELLKLALEKLKFKERLILTLAFFDEKDYREIGEIMDISINSVGAYLFRAKNKLAKIMKKIGGG